MKELSLSEIQQSSLNILKWIDEVCETNGIKYSLAYGTLLGAIRHKGFIPWDDDVDIMMARPYYEKFLSLLESKEMDIYPYEVLNMRTNNNCPHVISRVSDSRYKLIVENESDYGLGTFVDIYVVDGIGKTQEEAEKIISMTMKYPSLIFLSTRNHFSVGGTKGLVKRILKFPAYIIAKILGKSFWCARLNKIIRNLNYDASTYVGIVEWGERPKSPSRKVMLKQWINNPLLVDFEGYKFRAPNNYDAVLKLNYGDYMQLPQEKDRVPHHLYKAYKK